MVQSFTELKTPTNETVAIRATAAIPSLQCLFRGKRWAFNPVERM